MALRKKRKGIVHYSSAGAFAQTRLDKYLQQSISNFNGVPFVFPSTGFGGSISLETPVVNAKRAIVHDTNYGPFFTSTLDSITPFWIRWNAGLTEEQYQIINRIKVCPNGAIYVGFCAADDTRIFLATAPYLGSAFTVVEDYDSIHAKCGSPYTTRFGDFEVNPAEAEQIICAYNVSGIDQMHIYIGSGTTWTGGAIFTTPWTCKISAGLDNWFLTSAGNYVVLSGDGTSVITSGSVFSYLVTLHARLGATNETLHYGDGNLYLGHNYLTSYTTLDSSGVFPGIVGISPDGNLILTNRVSAVPLQSSDMGSSFTEVATLPAESFAYEFIGGSGTLSQWLAVAAEHIYYTEDFFGSDPVSKVGNLLDLVASPQLDMVKVLL